jgi:hypothetical protein
MVLWRFIALFAMLLVVVMARRTSFPSKPPSRSNYPTTQPSRYPTTPAPSTAFPTKTTAFPSVRPTTGFPTRPTPSTGSTVHPPPNVLLIIADDFKPMLGAYGSPMIKKFNGTPNLDTLSRQSTNFMNAHAQVIYSFMFISQHLKSNIFQMSVCGPSRASFLTGYVCVFYL